MARFFMFVRQFNDFCELLARILRNARQYNDFLVLGDTFAIVVQNDSVGSVFFSVFTHQFVQCFFFLSVFFFPAQVNRRRGVEI